MNQVKTGEQRTAESDNVGIQRHGPVVAKSREIKDLDAVFFRGPAPGTRLDVDPKTAFVSEAEVGGKNSDAVAALRQSVPERAHLRYRAATILKRKIGLNDLQDSHQHPSVVGTRAAGVKLFDPGAGTERDENAPKRILLQCGGIHTAQFENRREREFKGVEAVAKPDTFGASAAEPVPQSGILKQPRERVCQGLGVVRRYQQAVHAVFDNVESASEGCTDDRSAERHGFQKHEAESFAGTGQGEDFGAAIASRDFFAGKTFKEMRMAVEAGVRRFFSKARQVVTAADGNQV